MSQFRRVVERIPLEQWVTKVFGFIVKDAADTEYQIPLKFKDSAGTEYSVPKKVKDSDGTEYTI